MRTSIPGIHDRLIERPHLMQRLDDWRRHPVITVSAPAGFGKSTTMAMWVRTHCNAEVMSWLTLGTDDADPNFLILHLLEALSTSRTSHLDLRNSVSISHIPPEETLRLLLLRVANSRKTSVLIVDDAHFAADSAALLQTLVDLAPANLTLILLSRSRLLLQFPSATLHLDADDLRFNHDEFAVFAARTRLSDLPSDQLATIERRAEGWITALQLLSIASIRGNLHDVLDPSTSSSHDFLNEYLDQIVLHSLDETMQHFLTHVACTPWFDTRLAAKLANISTSKATALLNDAMAANLFLDVQQQTRSRHRAYRFHPLFRDFLTRELCRRNGNSALPRLRRIAAAEFERRNMATEAFDLYIRAEDIPGAIRLVHTNGRQALLDYDFTTLRRWLTVLGEECVAGDMELALQAAWLSYRSFEHDIRRSYERAARLLTTQPHHLHYVDQETELLSLETIVLFYENNLTAAHAVAQRAMAQPKPQSDFIEGWRFANLAIVLESQNDRAGAIAAIHTAAAAFARIDGTFGKLAPPGMLSDFQRRCGDIIGSLRSLDVYVHALERAHLEFTTEAAFGRMTYAETLYWLDQRAEAKTQWQHLLSHENNPAAEPFTGAFARLYLQICTIPDSRSRSPRIDRDADRAEWRELTERIPSHLLPNLVLLRVIRDGLLGDANAIRHTLETAGLGMASLPTLPVKSQLAVLAAAVFAGQTSNAISDALQRLQHETAPIFSFEVQIHTELLLALHAESAGRTNDAEAHLMKILPVLENSRTHRFALDYPALLPILQRLDDKYAQHLIMHMHANHGSNSPFGLPPREHEVLRLAANGRHNDEIARHIGVALSSIHIYFSRIYKKTNVRGRSEALRVFRQFDS